MMTVTDDKPVSEYMSRAQVAEYMGLASVKSLSNSTPLPPPDATIGVFKGWLPETIDKWLEERPGRGRHGARDIGMK